MDDLIDILESFNRKERFFLVAQALGQERGDKPAFTLSENFRWELEQELGFDFDIPADAFVAMDYHLNWVHASLVLARHPSGEKRNELLHNGAIKSSQQDVDLLVAFRAGEHHHLIFVEAKGYDTNGLADFDSGNQLESKAERLDAILNPNNTPYPDVTAYFCLMSGEKPTNAPPKWRNWLELTLPEKRLVVKYNASVREVRKGSNSQQIVPPKSKA